MNHFILSLSLSVSIYLSLFLALPLSVRLSVYWTMLWAVLVATLRSHGQANAALAEHGLAAIRILSLGRPANSTRLGEADACAGQRTRYSMCGSEGVGVCVVVFGIFEGVCVGRVG